MRRTPPAALLSALVALLLAPAAASAAGDVLVMDANGRVRTHRDAAPATTAEARPSAVVARALRAQPATRARAQTTRGSVLGVLGALGARGDVTPQERTTWAAGWRSAGRTLKKLRGARRVQLGAVVANLTALAKAGRLTPSRAPQAFLTLERNRAWWAKGPLLSYGQRVGFAGSELVWQFYPSQGIQVQWLGTFGKANAAYAAKDNDRLSRLLGEALELAAQRAGGLAFEYTFQFDGGRPPWVSGLAQGTGIQALSRAASRLGDASYADAARSALGVFRTPPPEGVRVATPAGAHYLQYSFAPRLRIVNGFVQSLNGLHDLAVSAQDAGARALFTAGEAELRAELPGFDTGAWSRYSVPGGESSLSYHVLLRDFLRSLCGRLTTDAKKARGLPAAAPYCAAEERFTADLTTPPVLRVGDQRARAKQAMRLRFRVDKASRVTLTLRRRGAVALQVSASLSRGEHWFAVTPRRGGPLDVGLRAVDLAGNAAVATASLDVLPAKKRKRG